MLDSEKQELQVCDVENNFSKKVNFYEDPPEENAEIVQLKQELEALKDDNVRLHSTIRCIELQWENDVLSLKKQIDKIKK